MESPEPTLLILADDLTGALDTGIQFAKNSISTGVLLSPAMPPRGNGPEVLVINTATRHRSPACARSVIADCLRRRPAAFVYKKTDSTLRGHIGAELETLMVGRNTRRLPFVPAYPALGRTTRKGFQYLRGQPVHETEMAADPLNPVTSSFIPAVIGEESALRVGLVPRSAELPPEPATEREILVFDAETTEDLREIARRLYKKNLLRESAGCAGFAEALMEVLPFAPGVQPKPPVLKQGPILIVTGSLHRASREQVKTALAAGLPGIPIPGEALIQPGWIEGPGAAALAEKTQAALGQRGMAILGTRLALSQDAPEGQTTAGHEDAARGIGRLVRYIQRHTGGFHLVIFGGDTLLGIAEALGFGCISPEQEIRPGVVLARIAGPGGRSGEDSVIVTKSGAFGEGDLILTIGNYLKNHGA